MEFLKEFATFMHQKGIIQFGDYKLASGRHSPYYIDMRSVPSYPIQFRKMIRHLKDRIERDIGPDGFDSIATVPTGGLVIASALAMETLKPLIYVRSRPKDYGTSKSIEGKVSEGMTVVMIDDVATTGGSVIKAVRTCRDAGITVKDAYIAVDRMEGADEALSESGVKMHSILNILEITETLFEENLIDVTVLERVKKQISD